MAQGFTSVMALTDVEDPDGFDEAEFVLDPSVSSYGEAAAVFELDQAAELLDDVPAGWDADRLFDVIRSEGVPVEDTRWPGHP